MWDAGLRIPNPGAAPFQALVALLLHRPLLVRLLWTQSCLAELWLAWARGVGRGPGCWWAWGAPGKAGGPGPGLGCPRHPLPLGTVPFSDAAQGIHLPGL